MVSQSIKTEMQHRVIDEWEAPRHQRLLLLHVCGKVDGEFVLYIGMSVNSGVESPEFGLGR